MQVLKQLLADDRIHKVWNDAQIPVFCLLPGGADTSARRVLLVRLPPDAGTRVWLRAGRVRNPQWQPDAGAWRLPVSWLDSVIEQSLEDLGAAYFIHMYKPEQRCTHSCQTARRLECECSCLGAYHRIAWKELQTYGTTEGFKVPLVELAFACRKLVHLAGGDRMAVNL